MRINTKQLLGIIFAILGILAILYAHHSQILLDNAVENVTVWEKMAKFFAPVGNFFTGTAEKAIHNKFEMTQGQIHYLYAWGCVFFVFGIGIAVFFRRR